MNLHAQQTRWGGLERLAKEKDASPFNKQSSFQKWAPYEAFRLPLKRDLLDPLSPTAVTARVEIHDIHLTMRDEDLNESERFPLRRGGARCPFS